MQISIFSIVVVGLMLLSTIAALEKKNDLMNANCLNLTTCATCILGGNCGWCNSTGKCVPGTSSGPDQGSCSEWDWTSCQGGGHPPPPPPPTGSSYTVDFNFTGLTFCNGGPCFSKGVSYCCTDLPCWPTNNTMEFSDQTPNGQTPDSLMFSVIGQLQCIPYNHNTSLQFQLNTVRLGTLDYAGPFDCLCSNGCSNVSLHVSLASGAIKQGQKNQMHLNTVGNGSACLRSEEVTVFYS